jgi:hypothetical protein
MLSLVRKGTHQISFNALQKLLPAIEQASTRHAAVCLHLAYLADETVETYKDAIRIEAIAADGTTSLDTYAQLSAEWEARSRSDPSFYAMWSSLDSYMHHPEQLTQLTEPDQLPRIAEPETSSDRSEIALLSEPVTPYHTTPRNPAGQK